MAAQHSTKSLIRNRHGQVILIRELPNAKRENCMNDKGGKSILTSTTSYCASQTEVVGFGFVIDVVYIIHPPQELNILWLDIGNFLLRNSEEMKVEP